MSSFWHKISKTIFFWRKRRKTDEPENPPSILNRIEDYTIPVSSKNYFHLKRKYFTDRSTIGRLCVDGKFECWILEDPVRKEKIPKVTAIPEGTYEVVVTYSPKFKCEMPLLKDVPNFKGIRIHPGNDAENTEGCLLPGQSRGKNFVGLSRAAYQNLFFKTKLMIRKGKVYIKIENNLERAEI